MPTKYVYVERSWVAAAVEAGYTVLYQETSRSSWTHVSNNLDRDGVYTIKCDPSGFGPDHWPEFKMTNKKDKSL